MAGDVETRRLAKILGREHHDLDALLAVSKSATAGGDIARASATFAEFRSGFERHIDAEEQVLFPAVERVVGATADGPLAVMRQEHAELRRIMQEVATALEGAGRAGLATLFAALTARIYTHNGKEERIVYPAADRALEKAGIREEVLRRWRAL